MEAIALGHKGETLVVAYEPHVRPTQKSLLSAFETHIEGERLYHKCGRVLADAIQQRGPGPNFWKNVAALRIITDQWALFHVLEGKREHVLADRPAFNTLIRRPEPGSVLVAYLAAASIALLPAPAAVEPPRSTPSWLLAVERRIRDSIRPGDLDPAENDGRWIENDIATAASIVLPQTAALLPSEPYLYASRKGDLVLESSGNGGKITMIIGADFVLFFVVVGDNDPITKKIELTGNWPARLKELQEISTLLRTANAVASRT